MKIALFGYGKMGKTIENIALKRGHTIVLKIDKNLKNYDIHSCDVAIDFSIPSAAFSNISKCLNAKIPIVSGTTGWLKDFENIKKFCKEKRGAFIYASNYSLGVNILFELNEYLAKMMGNLKQYDVSLKEIHHKQKLDAPSGTAITLAESIIQNTKYNAWQLDRADAQNTIPIKATRNPYVPGTHMVAYSSDVDTLEIKHTANNREGFALGAVIAGEWLIGKEGIFTMKDVLGIKIKNKK